ncbi:MAG: hypothetical protein WCI12_10145 [Actinomycetes bacterium]
MDEDDLLEPNPVDEPRRTRLALAALAVLSRDSVSPLERQWARQVYDLTMALGEARSDTASEAEGP